MRNTPKFTRTQPHLNLMAMLSDLGFQQEEERGFGQYAVDSYVPRLHAAFEADGPQHSQSSDKKRDAYLMAKYALPVFRMSAKDLSGTREEQLIVLARFLLRHLLEDSALARKSFARSSGWED